MPLTSFQADLAKLLSRNRSEDSYLAGGAAIHISPNSIRYSNDLDYFNDSVERVAKAFADDRKVLEKSGYHVQLDLNQPGYLRAQVSRDKASTKIEWAHDTAWRFMPVVKNEVTGFQLHPVDLAINKILALVGRNEARDFIDAIYVIENGLSLGALCWAAAGKDPGFTPHALLELLKRKGRYRPEDFKRLDLKEPVDLVKLKEKWLGFLDQAETFIKSRPVDEFGCLYFDPKKKDFFSPMSQDASTYQCHYGHPGGILPRVF